MQPTYTTLDAIRLMAKLDYEGLFELGNLLTEESNRYSKEDLWLLVTVLQLFLKKTRPV